jgi:heme-degrading monooxygenase HmoA
MTPADSPESRDAHSPIVRLHSFKVPVRSQSSFLTEFDGLLAAASAARGFIGHETFLGGRNPRHVVLLTAWASKRACETFFVAAESVAARRRIVFKYLDATEFFRVHEDARGLAFPLARFTGRPAP